MLRRKILSGFPSEGVSGRNIFHYHRAFFRFAIARFHILAEFDGGREKEAVSVLKCAKNAARPHKFVNFRKDFFAGFIRQGNKRQTANNVTDVAEL